MCVFGFLESLVGPFRRLGQFSSVPALDGSGGGAGGGGWSLVVGTANSEHSPPLRSPMNDS